MPERKEKKREKNSMQKIRNVLNTKGWQEKSIPKIEFKKPGKQNYLQISTIRFPDLSDIRSTLCSKKN